MRRNAGKLGHLLEVWWSIKFNNVTTDMDAVWIVLKTDKDLGEAEVGTGKTFQIGETQLEEENEI